MAVTRVAGEPDHSFSVIDISDADRRWRSGAGISGEGAVVASLLLCVHRPVGDRTDCFRNDKSVYTDKIDIPNAMESQS